MTLDYNIRIMITDNMLHPKTYEVTKVLDTFPLGCTKVTLKQNHYNQHTDLCGTGDFKDGKVHMVCDYYKSELKPIKPEDIPNIPEDQLKWTLSGANDKLYIDGQQQVITAVPNIEYYNGTCEWHIFIDNEEYTDKLNDLTGYFDIVIDNENNTFTISAINKDMVNYIVKVAVYDKDRYYYDSVEMEVVI